MDDVEFPIIMFSEGKSMLYYFDSKKEIHYTSGELLKKRVFKKTQLIDSLGKGYKIQDVEKTGYRGLWGFHPFFKGTSIKIKYTLEETQRYDFEDIKQFILDKLNSPGATRLFWGRTKQVLLDRLNAATSIKELLVSVK
ncbi:hypothetical protein [Spirosoma koreense]